MSYHAADQAWKHLTRASWIESVDVQKEKTGGWGEQNDKYNSNEKAARALEQHSVA